MLAQHYAQLLHLHVGCVIASGTLFCVRGLLRLGGMPLANHRGLRLLSYAIDTALLAAAIGLTLTIRQYPLVDGWLTTKLALLVIYVVLGSLALKRGRSPRVRLAAFAGALAVYAAIASVAMAHHPLGIFHRLTG
ncbi:MAG: SirB2 family protein [Nevskia sp.]|nr:SirB2 family protein [Nevskia sp.]